MIQPDRPQLRAPANHSFLGKLAYEIVGAVLGSMALGWLLGLLAPVIGFLAGAHYYDSSHERRYQSYNSPAL